MPAGRVFVFDVDGTLYPNDHAFALALHARHGEVFRRAVGLDGPDAHAEFVRLSRRHGLGLIGVAREHDGDLAALLADAHDVDAGVLRPQRWLVPAVAALPGRRLMFTNGPRAHAVRVVAALGLSELIVGGLSIEDMTEWPKPSPEAFAALLALAGVPPERIVLFEDSLTVAAAAAGRGIRVALVGAPPQPVPDGVVAHPGLRAALSWAGGLPPP
ncbi:MAG: HAD family hydrolase [Thermoleophilia bacterium]